MSSNSGNTCVVVNHPPPRDLAELKDFFFSESLFEVAALVRVQTLENPVGKTCFVEPHPPPIIYIELKLQKKTETISQLSFLGEL